MTPRVTLQPAGRGQLLVGALVAVAGCASVVVVGTHWLSTHVGIAPERRFAESPAVSTLAADILRRDGGSTASPCVPGQSRSTSSAGSSSGRPTTPVCGNGRLEGTEQCDDGNRNSGDGCSSRCLSESSRASSSSAHAQSSSSQSSTGLPACSDGLDNDGDGYSDCADPGCYLPTRAEIFQHGVAEARRIFTPARVLSMQENWTIRVTKQEGGFKAEVFDFYLDSDRTWSWGVPKSHRIFSVNKATAVIHDRISPVFLELSEALSEPLPASACACKPERNSETDPPRPTVEKPEEEEDPDEPITVSMFQEFRALDSDIGSLVDYLLPYEPEAKRAAARTIAKRLYALAIPKQGQQQWLSDKELQDGVDQGLIQHKTHTWKAVVAVGPKDGKYKGILDATIWNGIRIFQYMQVPNDPVAKLEYMVRQKKDEVFATFSTELYYTETPQYYIVYKPHIVGSNGSLDECASHPDIPSYDPISGWFPVPVTKTVASLEAVMEDDKRVVAFNNGTAAVLDFFLHLVPGVTAGEEWMKGDYNAAGLAYVSDVVGLFTMGGFVSKPITAVLEVADYTIATGQVGHMVYQTYQTGEDPTLVGVIGFVHVAGGVAMVRGFKTSAIDVPLPAHKAMGQVSEALLDTANTINLKRQLRGVSPENLDNLVKRKLISQELANQVMSMDRELRELAELIRTDAPGPPVNRLRYWINERTGKTHLDSLEGPGFRGTWDGNDIFWTDALQFTPDDMAKLREIHKHTPHKLGDTVAEMLKAKMVENDLSFMYQPSTHQIVVPVGFYEVDASGKMVLWFDPDDPVTQMLTRVHGELLLEEFGHALQYTIFDETGQEMLLSLAPWSDDFLEHAADAYDNATYQAILNKAEEADMLGFFLYTGNHDSVTRHFRTERYPVQRVPYLQYYNKVIAPRYHLPLYVGSMLPQ